jgi:hypothetical protein
LSRIYFLGLTYEELKKYTGKDGYPIFISINHKIFDVSHKGILLFLKLIYCVEFYHEGGSYSMFNGHDVSVALAHHQLENKYFNKLEETKLTKE